MTDPTTQHLHSAADALATAADATITFDTVASSPKGLQPGQNSAGWQPSARTAVTHVPPSRAAAQQLLADFSVHLSEQGIDFDTSLQLDALAGFFSSQFLLMAGPSGTGKSTLAAALASFFCPQDSWAIVESRRQLIGPEDIAGYYSELTGTYAWTPDLKRLLQVGTLDEDAAPPALVVEEINLSPVEGYLAPFTHGLSGPAAAVVHWGLHDALLAVPPQVLEFGPYPRLLGTINVDSTSIAPAPKVAARACVLLLEPATKSDVAGAISSLASLRNGPTPTKLAAGASMTGDPLEILDCMDVQTSAVQAAVESVLNLVQPAPIEQLTTRRQAGQLVLYCAWFALLAGGFADGGGTVDGDGYQIGAENALLHFVLPTLSPQEFSMVMQKLDDPTVPLTRASNASSVGGILKPRLDRLKTSGGTASLGGLLDFWDRLS